VESNHTTDKQLEAEWKKIKNQAEIARKFGVSRAWISKVFLKKIAPLRRQIFQQFIFLVTFDLL